ncbi:hypothetical protein B0T14DRAFT_342672 [Immersiella caudata]|uniref:Uncharacterized protein n=1 Tax=Immersiella caudata TaxID=314043 RepID=A0AA39WCZ0_9PEZI|nr:hypothetical protein B0T14DRAFT_342672 [Immersiella caudata]
MFGTLDVRNTHRFAAQQSLVRLLNDAFTFDGAVVNPHDKELQYIPVRGLMDSGSEAYLISQTIIARAGITESEMQSIKDLEIHGLEGAVCRPRFQIDLTWHMRRHANSRVSTFFVVEDTSFDILVPTSLLLHHPRSDSTSQAAYILQLRKKKDEEVEQERRNQAEQLRRGAAQEAVDAEERRLKRMARRKEKEEGGRARSDSFPAGNGGARSEAEVLENEEGEKKAEGNIS